VDSLHIMFCKQPTDPVGGCLLVGQQCHAGRFLGLSFVFFPPVYGTGYITRGVATLSWYPAIVYVSNRYGMISQITFP
jgi:hypothetical protein